MRRNISDLLDTYCDESVDLDGGTPLSSLRIKELTMRKIDQKSAAKIPERKVRTGRSRFRPHLSRVLLTAVIIVSLCCLAAFAIVCSLRDAARMDMGISGEDPIPEWTEHDDVKKAGEEQKNARVTLLSTMCSGEQLYAYIAISPIPEEIAAILADNTSPEYEWDLSGSNLTSGTFDSEQTSYDPETQTALVKILLRGEELEQIERVELTLKLTHNLKTEETYGPIVIPVTSSRMISCPADIPVENTKAHFGSAWGLRPGMPDIPDYVSKGRITRISICAGYIEVELETPGLTQWKTDSNVTQADFDLSPELADIFLGSLFSKNWNVSVNEALRGTTLKDKDGTSVWIGEIPRNYAGIWSRPGGEDSTSTYEGRQTYQFIPKQAFDISAVESITIGGTEYSFPTAEETGF